VRLGNRRIPVVLPSWRDPRLHLAAVIVSLQVLGQTSLHFSLSIAQILVAVVTCGVVEVAVTLWRRRVLMWPASALLTGNGVAFLLRVNGTRPGDWWSLHGAGYFALAAAVSLASKHLVQRGGRHLFNPSNVGLVIVFLAVGTRVVNPQDLWWGPLLPGLVLALVVIALGGITIVARLRLSGLVAAFWLAFAAGTGYVAAGGHCMTARWSLYPVCGVSYWRVLALSPEILVFMFFMITDPRTAPSGRVARIAFGAGVGLLAAIAVAPATTEFWTKVGVLAALTVLCALRPVLDRLLPAAGSARDRLGAWLHDAARRGRGVPVVAAGVLVPLLAAVALSLAALPARPAALAGEAANAAPDLAPALPRPHVALPAPAVPAVAIGASVRSFDAAITPARARQIAGDLAGDLAIEGQALADRDPALAASADAGDWLAAVRRQIAAAPATGAVAVASYRFSGLELDLVSNPARPQDPPAIGIRAQGTLVRRSGSTETAPEPFAATFSLSLTRGYYLIAGEQGVPAS
jgi:hypothetical protein